MDLVLNYGTVMMWGRISDISAISDLPSSRWSDYPVFSVARYYISWPARVVPVDMMLFNHRTWWFNTRNIKATDWPQSHATPNPQNLYHFQLQLLKKSTLTHCLCDPAQLKVQLSTLPAMHFPADTRWSTQKMKLLRTAHLPIFLQYSAFKNLWGTHVLLS